MARKLSPDGVPIEIPSIRRKKSTSLFDGIEPGRQKSDAGSSSGDDTTMVDRSERTTSLFPDDPPTRPANWEGSTSSEHVSTDSVDAKTRIAGGFRQGHSRAASGEADPARSQPQPTVSADPVVGWLVVIDGPGKGTSVRLGMGQNSIGRGEHSRVRINFGDDQISRSGHAVISYDPKTNSFHVHPGTGPNLTYIDGSAVLAPAPLSSGSNILLGETTLRFVALCNKGFNWRERNRLGDR